MVVPVVLIIASDVISFVHFNHEFIKSIFKTRPKNIQGKNIHNIWIFRKKWSIANKYVYP